MMAEQTLEKTRKGNDWLAGNVAVGFAAGIISIIGGLVLAVGGPVAAIAVIVGLLAAIVVLRDIRFGFWGVILIVAVLPFATIPVDIGLTPTFLDIALMATIGVWFLRLVTGAKRTITTSPVTLPLVLFMMVAIFSFIFGLANGPLTPNLLRHFMEMMLSIGFVLVVVDYFSGWERLQLVVKVLIVAGAAAAAIAIVIWILPESPANEILNSLGRIGYPRGFVIRYIEDNPEKAERAIGTSVDPNALGGLLLMVGALATPQVLSRRPLLPRWLATGSLGLIFIGLILTFSRGALAGLAAGIVYIALLRYRRLIPYLLFGALLFLVLPITQGYVARLVEGLLGQDLATQMRFGEYRDAVALIGRYPVFGVGFAGSPDIDLYLGVANVYLAIGQQMGSVGLIAFFAVVLTVFAYAYIERGRVRKHRQIESIWLGLHAAVVGGLVAGVFDHYLFNIDFHHAVTFFWLILGLSVTATKVGREMAVEV